MTQTDLNVIATIHEAIRHYQKKELDLAIRKLKLAIKLVGHKKRGNS
jgi:hypothetical protein